MSSRPAAVGAAFRLAVLENSARRFRRGKTVVSRKGPVKTIPIRRGERTTDVCAERLRGRAWPGADDDAAEFLGKRKR